MDKDEKMVSTEAVGCMLAGGREGKMEILGKLSHAGSIIVETVFTARQLQFGLKLIF